MTEEALEEEAKWDLRLDTITAFVHAACLVYIDGIGSGEPTSSLITAEFFSQSSLGNIVSSGFPYRNNSIVCR